MQIDRRATKLKSDDLGRRVKEEAVRMLKEGVDRQIHGASDALGHSLVIPGMKVEYEEGSSDMMYGHCAKCQSELRIYDATHPAYVTFRDTGAAKWTCNVCRKEFLVDSPDVSMSTEVARANRMFCCPTFVVCDWKACATCQVLVSKTDPLCLCCLSLYPDTHINGRTRPVILFSRWLLLMLSLLSPKPMTWL